jgi:hypothetical protein
MIGHLSFYCFVLDCFKSRSFLSLSALDDETLRSNILLPASASASTASDFPFAFLDAYSAFDLA